jgi:predicted DNA-binding transcriptional regulator YafY
VRASRLLSILLLLHTRGRVSAQELADELEVSVRTVYRDVEALGAAGIPVYATRGRAGGFALLDGYRTKLTGLTAEEADTLFLAGLPGAAADLGLGNILAATQLKLLAALSPELRARAEHIRDRFHLDAPGWERAADAPPTLAVVADAVWQQRRLAVRYQRANRHRVDRVLEPYGLVLKAGVWYLVAAVPDDDRGPRTYRLSRVEAATALDELFERPLDFELQEHWRDYQQDYERRLFRSSATIRLSADGRQLLFLIGSIAARAGHAAMGPEDAAGWASTNVPIESVKHATRQLMQLGAEVEVIEPIELRLAIARAARAMTACYGAESGGTSARGGFSSDGDFRDGDSPEDDCPEGDSVPSAGAARDSDDPVDAGGSS